MTTFVILLSLSGIFSGTFTLVFSYISDLEKQSKQRRVTAYGMATATLGFGFTMGPMGGGYIAQQFGLRTVFWISFALTLLDLCYIHWFLPVLNPNTVVSNTNYDDRRGFPTTINTTIEEDDNASMTTTGSTTTMMPPVLTNLWVQYSTKYSRARDWNDICSPLKQTLHIFTHDTVLQRVGTVAVWYYTAAWAVVSTLVLYAAQRFRMSPSELGELMSLLGFCTMVSEALLVRWLYLSKRMTKKKNNSNSYNDSTLHHNDAEFFIFIDFKTVVS